MATPQSVKQRAQKAEDLIRQQAEQSVQPETTEAEDEAAEQTNDDVSAAAEATESTDDGEIPVDRPDDVARQLADLRKELDQTNQRYRTLQGMVQHKEDENKRLHTLLAQINENTPAAPSKPEPPKVDPNEARDREEFGTDFVDMVNRAIDRRLSAIEKRLSATEGVAKQTQQTAQLTQQERFEAKLTKRVPDWREVDATEEFRDWLKASPTRVAIIQQAMSNYDPDAIAEMFELYAQLNGKGPSAADAPNEPASAKLESKVAPSKGRASKPNSAGKDKKVWTLSEIAQVFNNRRSYDQKEFERLQRDIFAAQNEGRVDYAR